jgi:Caspase domain/TPR repeat
MRLIAWVIVALALMLAQSPSGRADDLTTCFSRGTDDYKRKDFQKLGLAACSRVISSGKVTGTQLAFYYRGRGYWKNQLKDLDGALADYNTAVNLDPQNVEGYDYRADVWKSKGDTNRALADYAMAIQVDPTYAAAYYSRGLIYENQGNIDKARAEYSTAISLPEKDRIAKWAQDGAKQRLAALKADPVAEAKQKAEQAARQSAQTTNEVEEARRRDAEAQAKLREEQLRRAAAEEEAKQKASEVARLSALLAQGKNSATSQSNNHRFALLIGNQRYSVKVGPLKNPHNDVSLLEVALKKIGFAVTVLSDTDYRSLDMAIKRHISNVRDAGADTISIFYYSGHGAANSATRINYLIPVDVVDAESDDLWYQSFELSDVIDKLSTQAPDATHFVIFDACRDELKLKQTSRTLGSNKGFVPVPNTAGLLVAYATAPNKTASDLGAGSGPYAKALAEEIVKPGQEAITMFRNVQIKVKRATGQDPWLSFPSLRPVYFAGE